MVVAAITRNGFTRLDDVRISHQSVQVRSRQVATHRSEIEFVLDGSSKSIQFNKMEFALQGGMFPSLRGCIPLLGWWGGVFPLVFLNSSSVHFRLIFNQDNADLEIQGIQ